MDLVILCCFISIAILLVILFIVDHIKMNKRAMTLQGDEDQQRYGSKYSVGKIISYKKTCFGWRKR